MASKTVKDDLFDDCEPDPQNVIEIGGLKVAVVDSFEGMRDCDVCVCAPVGYFTDDVRASCADCGASIVHRPYVPDSLRKICIDCALLRSKPQ